MILADIWISLLAWNAVHDRLIFLYATCILQSLHLLPKPSYQLFSCEIGRLFHGSSLGHYIDMENLRDKAKERCVKMMTIVFFSFFLKSFYISYAQSNLWQFIKTWECFVLFLCTLSLHFLFFVIACSVFRSDSFGPSSPIRILYFCLQKHNQLFQFKY